jgi:hypothetical protein
MRTLVQNTYDEAINSICEEQILVIATDFGVEDLIITMFDYTYTPVQITVESTADSSLAETLNELGSEWVNIVARAASSRGRIQLHVMKVPEGSNTRLWVVPLRTNSSQRHDALLELAKSLPADWEEGFVALEVEIILDITNSEELVEIH